MDFVITDGLAMRRLDQTLARLLPHLSRSALAKLIEEGRVSVDGIQTTKKSQQVAAGQRISVEVPPAEPIEIPSRDLPLRILYEDDSLAVIDKPAGMVVHPAAGHRDDTLVSALLFHLRDLSGIGGELRPGIVHRLDKDTSGLMVVAKSDAAHRKLTDAWGTPEVRKRYVALVYGTPKKADGTIDRPIARDPRNRKRMAVVAGGRRAVTTYHVVERLRQASLLSCELKTGRTHQIRVHLASMGHPIVGDPVYSGPQWKGIQDKPTGRLLASMPRQALHAAELAFPHPLSGDPMVFQSPLPEDFARLVAALRDDG